VNFLNNKKKGGLQDRARFRDALKDHDLLLVKVLQSGVACIYNDRAIDALANSRMNKDEIVYLSFAYERWCDEKVDKFDLLQKTKQEKKKNTCWPILGYNSHHELSQLLVLMNQGAKVGRQQVYIVMSQIGLCCKSFSIYMFPFRPSSTTHQNK